MVSDRYKTVYHIMSECSKFTQKEYESRHDWVGKLIHWKLCKRLTFEDADMVWYMQKPDCVVENETTILLGFTPKVMH